MTRIKHFATAAVLGLALASPIANAQAAALFFNKIPVRTSSEATCLRFASDAARGLQLRNVRRNNVEVAGVKNGVLVSTVCVGRGNDSAIAVVMASGDNAAATRALSAEMANKIRGITCIDEC